MIELEVWFPDVGRTIRFNGMWVCSEYDCLCFAIDVLDKLEEYQHLAGKSYVPTGPCKVVGLTVKSL